MMLVYGFRKQNWPSCFKVRTEQVKLGQEEYGNQ